MGQSVAEVERPWPMRSPFTPFFCVSKVSVRKSAAGNSSEDCMGTGLSSW